VRFEWDPKKAKANEQKHSVGFSEACLVFTDKFELTLFDDAHSGTDERWITIGQIPGGGIIVVVHTHANVSGTEVVRIISARKATRAEGRQYAERRKG